MTEWLVVARPNRLTARLPTPAARTEVVLGDRIEVLSAMLKPRLPRLLEPAVVAVPFPPNCDAMPNNPCATAVDLLPSAVAKVNASPV